LHSGLTIRRGIGLSLGRNADCPLFARERISATGPTITIRTPGIFSTQISVAQAGRFSPKAHFFILGWVVITAIAVAVTAEDWLVQRAHASAISELSAFVAFLIRGQAVITGNAAPGADQADLGTGTQSNHIDRAWIVAREALAGRGRKPAGGATTLAHLGPVVVGADRIRLTALAVPDRAIAATAAVKHQIISATTDRRRGITAEASQLAGVMLVANIVIIKPMVVDKTAFAIVGCVAMGIRFHFAGGGGDFKPHFDSLGATERLAFGGIGSHIVDHFPAGLAIHNVVADGCGDLVYVHIKNVGFGGLGDNGDGIAAGGMVGVVQEFRRAAGQHLACAQNRQFVDIANCGIGPLFVHGVIEACDTADGEDSHNGEGAQHFGKAAAGFAHGHHSDRSETTEESI